MSTAAVSGTRRAMKEMADGTLRVQIDIDPPQKKAFLELFPNIDMAVGLAPLKLSPDLLVEAKKEPNYFARDLMRDGYFYALRLWLAMHDCGSYTMQQHKAYIETLACCGQAFHPHQCNGDIVLHHAHRAEDAAAGDRQPENPQKAPHYFGVPVCHTAHTWIHTQADRETKRLIREYAIKLTADQMKAALKRHLKITSLSDITPEMLKAFETEIGL